IQPSQTVAVVSEKHITANQSSEFTIPRRKVGREKAARIADGTASRAYSGSKESARKTMATSGHAANIKGSQICGAVSHERQRHMASSARGQVGQMNKCRPRRALSISW